MWQETKLKNKEKTSQALHREFEFADFAQAFDFMTRVAGIAEGVGHHPRWTNDYNKVDIWLTSHSAGGKVTEKDHKLAEAIDVIASEFIQ